MLINENDFKEAVPISVGFTFAKLVPDIKRVQKKYLRPILGRDLEAVLDGKYDLDTLSEDEAALVGLVQPALAHLTMWIYAPKGNLYVGDNGLQAIHGDDNKPAFQWQKEDYADSMRENGFDALDELISYLEEVAHTDFPDWLTSEGCTLVRSNFINTAEQYTLIVPKVRGSRYLFSYLRPIMARVEKAAIMAVTGKALFDELKEEILEDDLSAENDVLMDMIVPAVAHLTWADSIFEIGINVDGEGVHLLNNTFSGTTKGKQPAEVDRLRVIKAHHETLGYGFTQQMRDFLVENVETYPLFRDGETYDADDPDAGFVNDADNGIVALW